MHASSWSWGRGATVTCFIKDNNKSDCFETFEYGSKNWCFFFFLFLNDVSISDLKWGLREK